MLPNKTLTYVSLFSSAGVGCYGFKEVGFECIATNEIIQRRLEIQKINNKCKYESGYINGDIKEQKIKDQILKQIELYKKLGNDGVDVLIATPPCQGMSVANHKKKNNEMDRNSLVVESVDLIKSIKPKFFILENVSSFYKTGCIDKDNNIITIGNMIEKNLSKQYIMYNEVLNFKNYGANSSRTRMLVIGVCSELKNFIAPLELFPDFCEEKTLKETIGSLKSLEWGEYDKNDFYHSFRIYPQHMREWISDLKEGQSAFDNQDEYKKPHKMVDGRIIIHASKNGDKYKRQKWDCVSPCIHTRNDQLASQNTIHPQDDRVFSIRELMLLMNIPSNFKWLDASLETLNNLTLKEKQKISKVNEVNIRQSIGEAVPTIIFEKIAIKIDSFLKLQTLNKNDISQIISNNSLWSFNNLKKFIIENKTKFSLSTLSNIAELANIKRQQNSAYFTNKFILNEIAKTLPNFNQDSITIVEPSVGCGNFIPIIVKKYKNVKNIKLKLIDIDSNILEISRLIYENKIPKNFEVEFICQDFLETSFEKIDLIIGNPPFGKIKNQNFLVFYFHK